MPSTTDEIRELFLRFFEERGHLRLPSSSLVPVGDPTLLLTTAGMVQIKPYFTGEAVPPNPRLTSCQKCFRTTDIDSVGDDKHLTFFEMLGNFSVGDYFKKEAIAWAWEFVTQKLAIPKERLWITVFLDDDEAYAYWRALGVPESRILRYGEKDNFWGPAGDSGPCGPSSEIHYDWGEEYGCGPDCEPAHPCGRFLEIWNLVFTQFDQAVGATRRVALPRPNIDTGMGLERTVSVLTGKHSFYDTEIFQPLLGLVSELAGVPHGQDGKSDRALRIVAEHSRGIAFLLADGVVPTNEGRGYVLRRVLRRAVRFGWLLGLKEPFLGKMVEAVTSQMGYAYPELVRQSRFIGTLVEHEETRFQRTLDIGLELLEALAAGARKDGGILTGEDVFRLYDTYGFPAELTEEIAKEHGLPVDMASFQAEIERQRERARAAHKFAAGEKAGYADLGLESTTFLGYETTEASSSVAALLVEGEPVELAEQVQEVEVILRETPFYAEMGGQVGDTGVLRGEYGVVQVTNTGHGNGLIVHRGKVAQGRLAVNDGVVASVDAERRRDIMRNHTATHLLQAALRQVIGGHVRQTGSLVAPDRLRFDYSHLLAPSPEELREAERLVNEHIRRNLLVQPRQVPYRQALEEGAIALFDEKYGDMVRLVEIVAPEGRVSAELCGGTHCSATGEIGLFHITSEASIGSGMRRIEAVTGRGAEELVRERFSDLEAAARILKVDFKRANVYDSTASRLEELDRVQKWAAALETRGSRRDAELDLERKWAADLELQLERRNKERARIQELLAQGDLERAKALLAQADQEQANAEKRLKSILVPLLQSIREGTSRGRELLLSNEGDLVNNVPVIRGRVEASNMHVLRATGDYLRDQMKSGIIVLASVIDGRPQFMAMVTPDLVEKGYHAGEIVKRVAAITGGSGGGRAELAQAGGKDPSKIEDALRQVPEIVAQARTRPAKG